MSYPLESYAIHVKSIHSCRPLLQHSLPNQSHLLCLNLPTLPFPIHPVYSTLLTSLAHWGCSSVGRVLDRHSTDAGSSPGVAKDFSPRVNFQYRLSYGVRTPSCGIACIYIYAHVKDSTVVHVRVQWIMKTLKHLACTVSLIARLCRIWFSPEKATRISHGRSHNGIIQS